MSRSSNYSLILAGLVALVVVFATVDHANADKVLLLNNDSLTSYLHTSSTPVQNVRPLVWQRGTDLDGSSRYSRSTMVPPGNDPGVICQLLPDDFNSISLGNNEFSGDGLNDQCPNCDTEQGSGDGGLLGTYTITDIDISLPARGFRWVIGRTYNARQKDSGGSYYASAGYQGNNWFQVSQPELLFYDHPSDAAKDMLYLILGADRYVEFKRANETSDEFKSVNGYNAVFHFEEGDTDEPDEYILTEMTGHQTTFFGFDVDASPAEGQLWKRIDPAGNVAYVGDETTGSTAISSGFNGSGQIIEAYDTEARQYIYTYASGMLTSVEVFVDPAPPGGGYVTTGHKVEYSYYVNADSHGEDDDLKRVKVTTPLTDGGATSVRNTHYWYYEGAYHATNNPGYPGGLQYIINPEGYRGYDWDENATLDDDTLSASENDIKPYASAFFKYDTERRIVAMWDNGACGCGGGSGTGLTTFEYELSSNYSDNPSAYDEDEWYARTITKLPQDINDDYASVNAYSYVTRYFDEVGQRLDVVITDGDPDNTDPAPSKWVTRVDRDSAGRITSIHSPANVTSYTHLNASMAIGTSDTVGLVVTFTYSNNSDDLDGLLLNSKWKKGTAGTEYLIGSTTKAGRSFEVGDVTLTRPYLTARYEYPLEQTSGTTNANEYLYEPTWYEPSTATDILYITPKSARVRHPSVDTSKNGQGATHDFYTYFREDGTIAFRRDPQDIFTYTQFTGGQLTTRVDDVITNGSFPGGDDPNTDWGITESGSGSDRITDYTYDAIGRLDEVTQPDGRVLKNYYSKLADGRLATLRYNDYDSGGPTFYGPVQYGVTNLAGRGEAQMTIALAGNDTDEPLADHIDESQSDPIDAVDFDGDATLARLSTNIYDETGTQLEESRQYYDIGGSGYDATTFAYDDVGRRVRTKDATGTIHRTVFDSIGRTWYQSIGTNDHDWPFGEATDADDMSRISEVVYDGGGDDGNSYISMRKAFIDGLTTDRRDTSFAHDVRGRVLLVINPEEPIHVLNKYDNMGRLVATGMFSEGDGTDDVEAGDDPTSRTEDRLTLSQTFYDERGQVYKTQRHNIDIADGSDDGNIAQLTWFDSVGRTLKFQGESGITKMAYDRLGRQTKSFILADHNDTVYADADDVSGDKVLEEHQTWYESTDSDDVLMTVSIDRLYDDGSGGTSGALDTNADNDDLLVTAANLKGRAQIAAMWYDRFGRVEDTVRYGTYNAANFDRDGLSVPARSTTALRTTNVYDTDGTLLSVTDPKDLETRYAYDDLGRQITEIRNYVNGTPSGATGDDDVHTRFEYTNGLRTKMWVDFDGDDVEDGDDQVTEYAFGTTKGTDPGDSKIGTRHLLQKITYPDSTSGTDVVTFAYNAQNQQIWREDQAGNIIENVFDDMGRTVHIKATNINTGAGFDDEVERITYTYDVLGRRQFVTQWDDDDPLSGNELDEVKFAYDGWSNIITLQQDVDSEIGGAGNSEYEVSYTYTEATVGGGRESIQRTTMTYPNGNVLTYEYLSGGGRLDSKASRVTRVKDGAVVLATYDYNGTGHLVGTIYDEIDVRSIRYHPSVGSSMVGIDRFNRPTTWTWTKILGTSRDFYDVDYTWDENSNVTAANDQLWDEWNIDRIYTIDDLNRLKKEEMPNIYWVQAGEDNRTIAQAGAATRVQLELDGNVGYELDDTRVYNTANELQTRDVDSDTNVDYTISHDAVGNLTDDGESNEYIYDVFGRLRFVNNQSQDPVSEYRYNGLNWRISVSHDTDSDDDIDASDIIWYFVHDERWRIVAVYREDDSYPKEQFDYHAAGQNGLGTTSYIDDVILRDKDDSDDWEAAADDTLEERIYYCQNWRHDVVVLIDAAGGGTQVENLRYEAYGVPYLFVAGDVTADGAINATDTNQIQTWIDGPAYNVRGDLDLDGDVDATDKSLASANSSKGGGREKLATHSGNRKGYAGYEFDSSITHMSYHHRYRTLNSTIAQWDSPWRCEQNGANQTFVIGNPLSVFQRPPCPPGPAPEPEAQPQDMCCERARRIWDLGPMNVPAWGLTFCCDGRAHICNWLKLYPEWFPEITNDRARPLIVGCIDAHEVIHATISDCCPEGYTGEMYVQCDCLISRWCEECLASAVGVACLYRSLSRCGDDAECRQQVLHVLFQQIANNAPQCAACYIYH